MIGLRLATSTSKQVGLNDSPAGLAAWILEKFIEGSDESAMLKSYLSALASKFSLNDLLTNVMIY